MVRGKEGCVIVDPTRAHVESFLQSHWLSQIIADSQVFTLAAGTSEIMRDMLAGMLQM